MSRMFRHVTTTWNPIVGCKHLCVYCWARRLAVTKLRHLPQYKDGFETSKLVENAFKKRFKPGEFVFVSDMGDMFGSWVPSEWILKVINYIRRFPRTTFLFLTKNPSRYHEFIDIMPENTVLGTTIETDNESFVDMALGKLNTQMAFLAGKFRTNNPQLAVRLNALIEGIVRYVSKHNLS